MLVPFPLTDQQLPSEAEHLDISQTFEIIDEGRQNIARLIALMPLWRESTCNWALVARALIFSFVDYIHPVFAVIIFHFPRMQVLKLTFSLKFGKRTLES
jgi:hypothetical protein